MGGKADQPLRRFKTELGAHGAVDPGACLRPLRPHPFIEAAEHQKVCVLQAGFEITQDLQPRMRSPFGADHTILHQRLENGGIIR